MIKLHPVYLALGALVVACGAGQITDAPGSTAQGGSVSNPSTGGSISNPSDGGSTADPGSGGTTSTNGGSPATGNGGDPSSASGGTTSASGSGGACVAEALPTTVQSMLTSKCVACHGTVPLSGAPSLVTYADLTRAAASDASKTNAEVALARIQNSASPMPPAPGTSPSAAEIAALSQFISDGYPKASCPTGGGGSTGSGGAATADPLAAAPTCTSNTRWTQGNEGSASMNPGEACINCHKTTGGEGPTFSIAGTVYPTGHEPDLCNSKVGTSGAQVVIVGADGQTVTLTPNSAGNFSLRTAVKTPYQAKVTFQGRERLMLSAQTSGDCNSCHTQTGANGAPGRVTVP